MNEKLNNRLLSELIAHPDFPELMAGLEVFIDRTISENMEIINKTYKVAIDTVNRQTVAAGRDEYIATLQEANIDPDDYLRFRLSQRFDKIAQSLYDAHKKEAQSETGKGYLEMFIEQMKKIESMEDDTESKEQAKLDLLADQLGVNLKKAPEDEKQSLLRLLSRSKFVQFFKKRK